MYTGPLPNSINKEFPNHTYELITCLINGEQKRSLLNRYLKKLGTTREQYIIQFPGAPLLSNSARDAYKKAAQTETGRSIRSATIKKLNLENKEFQKNRKEAVLKFLNSDRSLEYRKKLSENAKRQHINGQAEYIRKYFKERFIGSENQFNRSLRLLNDPIYLKPGIKEKKVETYLRNSKLGLHNNETRYKKKKFKNTKLIYQSSYELDFLLWCESKNILNRIENSPCISDKAYPYAFYAPDYILDSTYIIEVKSSYIERLQEKKHPGILKLKEQLVIKSGHRFLYILDKNYSLIESII